MSPVKGFSPTPKIEIKRGGKTDVLNKKFTKNEVEGKEKNRELDA